MAEERPGVLLKRFRLWLLRFFPEHREELARYDMVQRVAHEYHLNGIGYGATKRGLFFALNETLRNELPLTMAFEVLEKHDPTLGYGEVRVEVYVK